MPEEFSPSVRFQAIRITISACFISGIFLSFPLWINERSFPLVSVVDFPDVPFSVSLALIFCFILLLLLNIFNQKTKLSLLILTLLLILLLQDQNRWQPWVFIYALVFTVFVSPGPDKPDFVLNLLRLIFPGIYIWSGIHKLNPGFVEVTYHSILAELLNIEDKSILEFLMSLGWLIPATEIFLGIAIFFPKTRNPGVILAILTHTFILLYLSPLGINHNSVVIPWNIAMMVTVFILYWNTRQRLLFPLRENWIRKTGSAGIVLIVWIMPLLNFAGYWDNYLSFSFYSDKTSEFYIAVGESELGKLNNNCSKYFVNVSGMEGGKLLNVNKWALGELNVPFYPETRTFKLLSKNFCQLGIAEDKLVFLELRSGGEKEMLSFGCGDLK